MDLEGIRLLMQVVELGSVQRAAHQLGIPRSSLRRRLDNNVSIDRNVVRTNGLITTLCLVAYVITGSPLLIVPIAVDYVMRASMSAPASPMTRVAQLVASLLGLRYRAMDKAPKVFASRIGVCFSAGAAITHFVSPAAALWVAGTLP
jgi:hypothetical protein